MNGSATPAVGQPVTFTIVATFDGEMAGGATLSAATVMTDSTGTASVDLTAGSAMANFRVTAEAQNAPPVTISVMVNDTGFAELTVHPLHQGPRVASPFVAIEVHLFQNQTCSSLVPESLPAATFPPEEASDGGTVSFSPLSPSTPYAVLAFAAHPGTGDILASGCAEIAAGQLRAGAKAILDLPVVERPLVLASSYRLSGSIDLGRVRDAVAAPGSPWATLHCASGPAQLVLDCAIDLLDGNDPDDCVVSGPGALATKLQKARTALVSGCRNAADGVEHDVTAVLGTPATTLGSAAATLDDLLDAMTLAATLVPDGRVAHLRLTSVEIEAGGMRFPASLPTSARPIIAVPVTLSGANELTLGPAPFGIQLGALVAASFRSRTALGDGTGIAATLFGSASATCAQVSATLCGAADEATGCLVDACIAAQPLVARVLDQPFVSLTLPGADVELEGTVFADGVVGDLAASRLTNGVWDVTVHEFMGSDIEGMTGVFDGTAQ